MNKNISFFAIVSILIFNTICANAQKPGSSPEEIKSCWIQEIADTSDKFRWILMSFNDKEPSGVHADILRGFTDKLRLILSIEKQEEFNVCIDKMKNGQIDTMPGLRDKDDRRDYMVLIPYLDCPTEWKCEGNGKLNLGISKKSDFVARVDEFKNIVMPQEEYNEIYNNHLIMINVGYRDLKFGVSKKEADSTKVVKEGVLLFGKKRKVGYEYHGKYGVIAITVLLGEYDQGERNKVLEILSEKYEILFTPDDIDFKEYNKINLDDYQSKRTRSLIALNEYIGADRRNQLFAIRSNIVGEISWYFRNGAVSFRIAKLLETHNNYYVKEKDIMLISYLDNKNAKKEYDRVIKLIEERETKTSSDDF